MKAESLGSIGNHGDEGWWWEHQLYGVCLETNQLQQNKWLQDSKLQCDFQQETETSKGFWSQIQDELTPKIYWQIVILTSKEFITSFKLSVKSQSFGMLPWNH